MSTVTALGMAARSSITGGVGQISKTSKPAISAPKRQVLYVEAGRRSKKKSNRRQKNGPGARSKTAKLPENGTNPPAQFVSSAAPVQDAAAKEEQIRQAAEKAAALANAAKVKADAAPPAELSAWAPNVTPAKRSPASRASTSGGVFGAPPGAASTSTPGGIFGAPPSAATARADEEKVDAAFPVDRRPRARPSQGSFGDLMAFDGSAPELVNGRLAMCAFVLAVGGEASSHQTVFQQFGAHPQGVLGLMAVVTAASFAPQLRGADMNPSNNGGRVYGDASLQQALAKVGAVELPEALGRIASAEWAAAFRTPSTIERWNGRSAMVGFGVMALVESFTRSSLF